MKNKIKQKVFSGIRATGQLHLGNYLGAVKGMLALQETHDCIFSVVDLHTITTPYDPDSLQNSILEIAIDYLAAGLDPKKCKIEVQSFVPEHIELAYLLSTIYPVSRLQQLPTYKDKTLQHPKYQNMGLLFYPILMAADILLYKTELVPAGVDQEPHIEVTREIARKFNAMFGETFPKVKRMETVGEYVPSLLGTGKMSKSVPGSYINLADSPDVIYEKMSKAKTDSGPQSKMSKLPEEGAVANLFKIFGLFDVKRAKVFESQYLEGSIKYMEMKETLAEVIIEVLQPIREKRNDLERNKEYVKKILLEGSIEARHEAKINLNEVKQKMGLI